MYENWLCACENWVVLHSFCIDDCCLDRCVDGQPAAPACITVLEPGELPTIAAVGSVITNYSYSVVYEPLSNGAYFLGELQKFVHVSPQRFDSLKVQNGLSSPCGFSVQVHGTSGEALTLVGVDPHGVAHVKQIEIPHGTNVVTVTF